MVESFKSTLDEVREADLLIHVVDISHKNFEDHIHVVKQTLQDIGAGDKPVIMVFNKTDLFTYTPKEEDDLTPETRENMSLEQVKKTWMKNLNESVMFMSAQNKEGMEDFKKKIYETVKAMHIKRYPYNSLLY